MGMISEPVIPDFKGLDQFKGPCFHSARWPAEGLDYAGKRMAIIGSGATTVQMLPVVAQTAAEVTVFQRTANFIMPAVQKPMTPEWDKEIKKTTTPSSRNVVITLLAWRLTARLDGTSLIHPLMK